jgi:thymidylate synthase
MSIAPPRVIQSSNISDAWGRVFLDAYNSTPHSRTPVVLSLAGFAGELPDEDVAIRLAVDEALRQCEKNTVAVSGMTIFPYDLWRHRGRPPCEDFNQLCVKRFFPRLKACDARNRLGTYFERMMYFTGMRGDEGKTVDQLGFIIDLLRKSERWPRQSALQMSCFDPAKDHTGQPVRGFPCLQQVGLSHDGDKRIAVHAFYPTQYIFDRAYGNYLGLCHLGSYIAHQTGLRFARLNCYIGEPHLGDVNKRDVADLANAIEQRLSALHGTQ